MKSWMWRTGVAAILLPVIACASASQVAGAEPRESGSKPEEIEKGKLLRLKYDFQDAKKEMEYAMYLPTTYDGIKRVPLIVALHGLYSGPWQILSYPGFIRHAEKNGYVLVAPMGYNSRGWYGSRGKGGGRRSDPKNLGELSEQDVMNVLALVRERFRIDHQRIYLFGHSMGGGGSVHLAIKYPEIWAGVALVAPAAFFSRSGLERARHIPAIVIQGAKDRLVPVAGTRRWIEKMKQLDMKHRYIEVKGGGHLVVAWTHFDEIFQFFAEHSKNRGQAAKPAGAP